MARSSSRTRGRPKNSLPARTAVVGFAKAFGLRVFLAAEPALGSGHGFVAAAGLQMIDAEVAGDVSAHRELALDGAVRRRDGLRWKQDRAGFAILVAAAGPAEQ